MKIKFLHFKAIFMVVFVGISLLVLFDASELALRSKFSAKQNIVKKEIEKKFVDLDDHIARESKKSLCYKLEMKNNLGELEKEKCWTVLNIKVMGDEKEISQKQSKANFDMSIKGVVTVFGLAPVSHMFGGVGNIENKAVDKSGFVVILEWLIWLTAFVQFCILIISRLFRKWTIENSSTIFHLSDWALNSPPIFGVLVNLYSFAEMLAHGIATINGQFLQFFGEAVVTTIIGGMVYVINLFIKTLVRYE